MSVPGDPGRIKSATSWGGPRRGAGGKPGYSPRHKPDPPAPIAGLRWYCLVTPAGHELWAIMEAVTADLAVLLPLHQPEKDAVWTPVYPGFVFVRFDRVDFGWRRLVDADRGWRLLGPDQEHPAVVPDAEVERMRHLYGPEGSSGEWKPPPPRPGLSVGSRVMVADGPLTSFPGTVVEDRGERVIVSVEIFGRITECDLPRDAVEPA